MASPALGTALRLALLLGVLAVLASGPACVDDRDPADRRGDRDGRPRVVLRPGDSLLDLLPLARFEVEPGSGLPPSFGAAARTQFVLRTPKLPLVDWVRVTNPPKVWKQLMASFDDPPLWRAALPAVRDGQARPLRVLVDDVPCGSWDPATGPPPPGIVWWEHSLELLLAVSEQPPSGVSVDVAVDPMAELGPLARVDPSPSGHRARRELGDVTRPSVIVPPPGVLEFEIDELRACRLHVSLGMLDQAWAFFDDVFHRTLGLSDGAHFALEVNGERVFERTLDAGDLGRGWVDDVVDLSPWLGQALTLRLVTEPGPAGDPHFDWALWGDLRLRGGAHPAPARPHVVLIHVDTLRADRVGGADSRTPAIDAWAEQHAVRFDDAQAPAPWTLPSTVSMLTGLATHQHGAERSTHRVGAGAQLLAERLSAVGYETWGLAAGGYLRPQFGFDRGFDRYEIVDPKSLNFSSLLEHVGQRDSQRPLFLFLHTYHVHAPYRYVPEAGPPGYDGPLAGQDIDYENVFDPYRRGELDLSPADMAYVEALYDGHVRRMDAAVGELLQSLERQLAPEGLMLVLTSDHGEGFGEHDQVGHGAGLWNEQLSVPLLMRFPQGEPGRRDDPVTLMDIVPTLLEVLALPADTQLAGRGLAQLQPADRLRPASNFQRNIQRSVQVGSHKLVRETGPGQPARTWLFDLAHDAAERDDLHQAQPRVVESLSHGLRAWIEAHPAPQAAAAGEGDVGAELREQLRALGYLGDG